jgi:hypothetical protein
MLLDRTQNIAQTVAYFTIGASKATRLKIRHFGGVCGVLLPFGNKSLSLINSTLTTWTQELTI